MKKHSSWGLRFTAGVAAAGLVGASLTTPAHAKPDLGSLTDYVNTAKKQAGADAVPNKWFVQVSGKPTDEGGSASTAQSTQQSVLNTAKSRGLKVTMTRSFKTSFNGMTVDVSDSSVAELASLPGVVKVWPVIAVKRPVTTGGRTSPNMETAINLTGASVAQNELGLSGQGIRVGIIDTGVDIDHPDFGGSGTPGTTKFPTKKIPYGYDFVGDGYDASKAGARAVPDANPDDCEGHGSHVAGIAAADGDTANKGVRGVAPKATLGAYRVFGCTGSTDSDIILAALEMAGKDKMDVVNMSIGYSFMSWPDYPTAQASDRLHKKGVVVVASAGNEGEYGLFSSGAPGISKHSIGVANFHNTRVTQRAFTDSTGKNIGYTEATGAPRPPASGSHKLVPAPAPGTGCAPLPAVTKGDAYLIQRGTCSFRDKALAAQRAGAGALVMYNNAPGVVNPTVEGDPAITIPVVMISQADGQALAAAAAAGEVSITWGDKVVTSPDENAGLLADSSSWGLAADLTLKPDLGAPGSNIWAPIPLEKGGHGSNSGTSMSAPHVAGAVALLLQARPELKGKPTKVREVLQNTSAPAAFSFLPETGLPDLVARQGAGMINIVRAVATRQGVTPSKISLGDQQRRPVTTTLTIKNDSKAPVTYTVSNLDGVGAVNPSNPEFDILPATIKAPATVTVKARGKATIKVTISQPAEAPTGYIYGGWVVLKGDNGSTLRVPYAGMAGDYQSLNPIQDNGNGFPWLAKLTGTTFNKAAAGTNFTMQGADVPYVLLHLEYPVSDLQLWVYKANADGSKGELLSRQPVLTTGNAGRDEQFTALSWDGSYKTKKGKKSPVAQAPAGAYIIEVRALKALGDKGNPAHWQSVTTPVFSIGSGRVDPNLKQVQVDPNAKTEDKTKR